MSDAGASLKKAKQYRAAVSHFRRAIAMCPEHPLLWENLGATLWDLSDMEGALAAYEHAKTLG
ncbi:MAG: tetratricopeptide repeat protein, partial [Bradyrhizobium sp.]